jgi:hypothetical protein
LSGSLEGVQNGDNVTASYSTVATTLSPVGPYDITPSLNDPDRKLTNYVVTTNNGTLSVTPATLTGTADHKSRQYGETNPVFTVTYSGFVNSENASIVTGTLLSSTTAETNSPVGNYPITVGGQSAANYTINYVAGTLTITEASSSLALVSSLNPSAETSNVTFTVTVSPVSPATPTPTGSVQFFANGIALGSPASLVSGVAAISTSGLAAGSNDIAAVYLGDGNFGSSSNTLVQVVTLNLAQPITLGIKANGNGTVTVSFQGTPGGQYIVQATTNLGQPGTWSSVSTNIAGADGLWTFTDSTTQSHKFYRAAK